ncbi:hypothetical protein FACS189494_01140 [Spirochaetia bacterium]|nr:hypothetical protein FACS189494_01140 [Spirochaetia bacterium]
MNFEKLVSNLQEEQNRLESQVLPYCNPKQIAHELMSNLETASLVGSRWETPSGYQSEVGSLFTSYELWYVRKPDQWDNKGLARGPLSNCNDRHRLSQVVLDLVKKYITDDIVKLVLDAVDDNYTSTMYIYATISRADVENLQKMS